MHTHGSSDHSIKGTDKSPHLIYLTEQKSLQKRNHSLNFVACRMKVSNYVDSDD